LERADQYAKRVEVILKTARHGLPGRRYLTAEVRRERPHH
jgi:hypothetical protein